MCYATDVEHVSLYKFPKNWSISSIYLIIGAKREDDQRVTVRISELEDAIDGSRGLEQGHPDDQGTK